MYILMGYEVWRAHTGSFAPVPHMKSTVGQKTLESKQEIKLVELDKMSE